MVPGSTKYLGFLYWDWILPLMDLHSSSLFPSVVSVLRPLISSGSYRSLSYLSPFTSTPCFPLPLSLSLLGGVTSGYPLHASAGTSQLLLVLHCCIS